MDIRSLRYLTYFALLPLTGATALAANWPAAPWDGDPAPGIHLPPAHPSAAPFGPQGQKPKPLSAPLLVRCGSNARGGGYARGSQNTRREGGINSGEFHSVNAAAAVAPPGATILILPPGQGSTTCVESVDIRKPLTIATYGGGRDAVIQAPPNQPCLVADIPLGDALIIDGVHFVARDSSAVCLSLKAGQVELRNSHIDSRRSSWALDAERSVTLEVSDTHIETDGAGIRTDRAHVDFRNVDIDISGEYFSKPAVSRRDNATAYQSPCDGDVLPRVGLKLMRTDGAVEGGRISGGVCAVSASSGTHDLRLTGIGIRKSVTGVEALPGEQGNVMLQHIDIAQSLTGIAVAGSVEASVIDNTITDVFGAGIDIADGAHARVDGNTIYADPHGECIVDRSGHRPLGRNICHRRASTWLGRLFCDEDRGCWW
jgi:hypothetical protein